MLRPARVSAPARAPARSRVAQLLANMATVWDEETIFKLIDTFKTKRILWDCATWSKDYKNRVKKNDAWEEIAQTLGISKLDVESKMHTLRSQYARERKKLLSLSNSGIADSEISKWKFYEPLKFLASGNQKHEYKPEVIVKVEHANEIFEVELTDSSTQSCSTPELQQPSQAAPASFSHSKRSLDEDDSVVKPRKKIWPTEDGEDEFDIYAQYVASELRSTRDEYSVLRAKFLINNILFEMRTGKLKNTDT